MSNPHAVIEKSMTEVNVGGESFPLVTSPRCSTCQSPHRRWIENQLISGYSYPNIARDVAEMDTPAHKPIPSAESIKSHVRTGHMVSPGAVRRHIIENRAESMGLQIDGEHNLTTYLGVNDIVIQRGMERMLSGEIEPGMNDLLTAIRNRHQFEKDAGGDGIDNEAWQQTMMFFMSWVQNRIGPVQFQEWAGEWKRDPILASLTRQMMGQPEPEPQTVMGQSVSPTEDENI